MLGVAGVFGGSLFSAMHGLAFLLCLSSIVFEMIYWVNCRDFSKTRSSGYGAELKNSVYAIKGSSSKPESTDSAPDSGDSSQDQKEKSRRFSKAIGDSRKKRVQRKKTSPPPDPNKTTKALEDLRNGVSNAYLDFINERRTHAESLSDEEKAQLTKHHIVPGHHFRKHGLSDQFYDLPMNLVPLSFEDHIRAHELRYETYKEAGDRAAFTAMKGLGSEGMAILQKLGGQAANKRFKARGELFHNPEYQREMARRSMERPDALEIRSAAGKQGARKSRETASVVKETDRFEWSYKDQPIVCTFGFNHAGDLLEALQKVQVTEMKKVWFLVTGARKKMYGWSCTKIENTDSQARSVEPTSPTNLSDSSDSPSDQSKT